MTCPACRDTGIRSLPVNDDLEDNPCPCCAPQFWPRGFPGEYVRRGGRVIWIIRPSDPGVPAVWVGWPAPIA